MKFASASYHKEMQKQLRIAVKGTVWRQAKGVVFRQVDDWFIAGHWQNVSANASDGIRIEILAKPMAIDSMLWEVMGLEDNNAKPLSFRYWGAFICGTPVLNSEVIEEIEPERAMTAMLDSLARMLPGMFQQITITQFSDIAKNPAGIHDNWRMGETITHALRLEGEPDLALEYATSRKGTFSNSRYLKNQEIAGKAHNELVASKIKNESNSPSTRTFLQRLFGR